MEAVLESPEVANKDHGSDKDLVSRLFDEIKDRRPELPSQLNQGYQDVLSNFDGKDLCLICYTREEARLVKAAVLSKLKWNLSAERGYTSWNETAIVWEHERYADNLASLLHVYEIAGNRMRNVGMEERRRFCDNYFFYIDWLGKMAGCYSNDPPDIRVLQKIGAYPLPLDTSLPDTNAA
ncbi:hypothetical protein JW707_03515 [Candidatus Woesearchaeota archaeon]|nr:hypothetical protein [Candidatus Woesearchaeota archaeon]